MFEANRQKEKAATFPFYEKGNINGPTFIDAQIALLQAGVIDFEFLNFIEANP